MMDDYVMIDSDGNPTPTQPDQLVGTGVLDNRVATTLNDKAQKRGIRSVESTGEAKSEAVVAETSETGYATGAPQTPDTKIVPLKPAPVPNAVNKFQTTDKDIKHRAESNKSVPGDDKNGPTGLPVLAKMLLEPYDKLIPRSNNILLPPNQSSVLRFDGREYITATGDMCDSLLLYSVHGELPDTKKFDWEITNAPVDIVLVSNNNVRRAFTPSLTPLGEALVASLNASRTDTATIRSLMASPPYQEQATLQILLRDALSTSEAVYHEEAMPLRLLCLLQSYMPIRWYEAKTQILLSLNFFSGGYKYETTMVTKHVDTDTTNTQQISVASGTSTLYIRSQQKYLSARADRTIPWGDDPVIVPIKQSWLDCDWLLAYIIAFTTTKWWNHTRRFKWYVKDKRFDTAVAGDAQKCLWLTAYPKGNTVLIDGDYKDIVLIIVDATPSTSQVDNRKKRKYSFLMGKEYDHDDLKGFKGMAEIFYNYLGRSESIPEADRFLVSKDHIMCALAEFTAYLSNPAAMQRVYTYAAILLGTFTAGNTVSTERASGAIRGVYNYNLNRSKTDNRIGGKIVPDMVHTFDQGGKDIMTQWTYWRLNCLGLFCHSSAFIGTGDNHDQHRTQLIGFDDLVPTWVVTVMGGNNRLLMMNNIFENYSTKHSTWEHNNENDLLNYIYAHSSILAAITNWTLAEMGSTLFDANKLSTFYKRPSDKSYMSILALLTDGFFNEHINTQRSYIRSKNFRTMFELMTAYPNTEKQFDEYYGLFMPFWYVKGIVQKMGVSIGISQSPAEDTLLDLADGDQLDLMQHAYFYNCCVGQGSWYDMNLMTGTMEYDRLALFNTQRFFPIYLPTRSWNGYKTTMMPWWPYSRNTAQYQNFIYRAEDVVARMTNANDGVIETMMLVRPDQRVRWLAGRTPQVYISPYCHQKRNEQRTWLEVHVEIPDPLWDYLVSGILAVGPYLVQGDIHGLVLNAAAYGADKLYQWVAEWFRGEQDIEERIEKEHLY